MKKAIVLGFVMAISANAALAQDFWLQRSYKRWTKDEIVSLISDSPWAQVAGDASNAQVADAVYVTVRLRSSILIRQALVRLKMIDTGYLKFDPAKKAEFDASMKGTLDSPACADNYVVTISPPITERQVRSGIFSLMNVKLEQLKETVYLLNDKGEKRMLVHFQAPLSNDGEATLFFPRRDDKGAPLLTAESKMLTLIFERKGGSASQNASIPRTVKFDVTKAMIDGNIEF